MKNMDRRLKKIIFLLITMLLTMLFLLLYTIYSYKYAYVNGNVIKAEDDYSFTIYEGTNYQNKAEGFNAGEVFPGDSLLNKTYFVNVSYNGDVDLNFRIKDVVIGPTLDTTNNDLSVNEFLKLFDVEIISQSINRTEHPDEPEIVENEEPKPIKCNLNDLYTSENNCYKDAIFKLSSKSDTDETIQYDIKISLATDVNDNLTEGLYGNTGEVIANSIQGHNVQYSLEWFVDTDKPDPHHDDDDDDDHGGGHLIPETGIFGLRLTRKQTTYFYFILAILLLLAIIVYKKIKEDQKKNNGRE